MSTTGLSTSSYKGSTFPGSTTLPGSTAPASTAYPGSTVLPTSSYSKTTSTLGAVPSYQGTTGATGTIGGARESSPYVQSYSPSAAYSRKSSSPYAYQREVSTSASRGATSSGVELFLAPRRGDIIAYEYITARGHWQWAVGTVVAIPSSRVIEIATFMKFGDQREVVLPPAASHRLRSLSSNATTGSYGAYDDKAALDLPFDNPTVGGVVTADNEVRDGATVLSTGFWKSQDTQSFLIPIVTVIGILKSSAQVGYNSYLSSTTDYVPPIREYYVTPQDAVRMADRLIRRHADALSVTEHNNIVNKYRDMFKSEQRSARQAREKIASLSSQSSTSFAGVERALTESQSLVAKLEAELRSSKGTSQVEIDLRRRIAELESRPAQVQTVGDAGLERALEEALAEQETITENLVQEALGWQFGKTVEKVVDRPVDRVVEKVVDRPVDRVVEKIVDRPYEVKVPVDRVVEKVVDRPVDRVVEKVVDRPVDRVVNQTVPVEKVVEVPVERVVEVPVEKIVERPVNQVDTAQIALLNEEKAALEAALVEQEMIGDRLAAEALAREGEYNPASTEEIEILRRDLAAARGDGAELYNVRAMITRLRGDISNLEAVLASVQDQNDELRAANADLTRVIEGDTSGNDLVRVREEFGTLTEEKRALEVALVEQELVSDRLASEALARDAELSGLPQQYERTIASKDETINIQRAEIEALQAQTREFAALKQAYVDLEAALIEQEHLTDKVAIEALAITVDSGDFFSIQAEAESGRARLLNLQRALEDSELEVREQDAEIERLRQIVTVKESEFQTYGYQLQELRDDVAELEAALASAQDQNDELRSANADLARVIEADAISAGERNEAALLRQRELQYGLDEEANARVAAVEGRLAEQQALYADLEAALVEQEHLIDKVTIEALAITVEGYDYGAVDVNGLNAQLARLQEQNMIYQRRVVELESGAGEVPRIRDELVSTQALNAQLQRQLRAAQAENGELVAELSRRGDNFGETERLRLANRDLESRLSMTYAEMEKLRSRPPLERTVTVDRPVDRVVEKVVDRPVERTVTVDRPVEDTRRVGALQGQIGSLQSQLAAAERERANLQLQLTQRNSTGGVEAQQLRNRVSQLEIALREGSLREAQLRKQLAYDSRVQINEAVPSAVNRADASFSSGKGSVISLDDQVGRAEFENLRSDYEEIESSYKEALNALERSTQRVRQLEATATRTSSLAPQPYTSTLSSGNQPYTSSSVAGGSKPYTPTLSSGNQPYTSSSVAGGSKPYTPTLSSGNQPYTSSSVAGAGASKPYTPTLSSGNQPYTSSSVAGSSSVASGSKPYTPTLSSGNQPYTSSSVAGGYPGRTYSSSSTSSSYIK